MAHISRPFQVAVAAVAVLALVWVFALHRPSSSPSEAQSSSQPAAHPSGSQKATAGGSKSAGASGGTGKGVYHGSAPGVEGLTRAIAKAHGAVAATQQNAKQLQEKSEQASSAAPSTGPASPAASAPSTTHALAPATPATKSEPTPAKRHATQAAPPKFASIPVLARQHAVEAELKQGKTVVLLFWSSKGSDDVAVRNSVRQLAKSDHRLVLHLSAPGQVASFGSITRGVQVYGTPTILIVAKHGRTIVLSGLQDAFAIRQAVSDARHA
jgi:hypothetical protein